MKKIFPSIVAACLFASCHKVVDIGDIVGYNESIHLKTFSTTDIDIDEYPGNELKIQVDYDEISTFAFEQKISIAPISEEVEIRQFEVYYSECTDTIPIDTMLTYFVHGCGPDTVNAANNKLLYLPTMVLVPELPVQDTFLSRQVRFQYQYYENHATVYDGVVNTNIFFGPSFTDAYILVRVKREHESTYAVHFTIDDNQLNLFGSVLINRI